MGAGKTTVAEALSRGYGLVLYDIDQWIEKEEGRSISRIFSESGEAYFRRKEMEILDRILALPPGVIATGGGTFVGETNREKLLKNGLVVYLEASAQALWERAKNADRPLLQGGKASFESFQRILQARTPFYDKAHHRVWVEGRSPESVAGEVWELYWANEGSLP